MKDNDQIKDNLSKQIEEYKRQISNLKTIKNKFTAIEKEFKESEKKYKILVHNSLAGIYITQKHILKYCNKRFAQLFGYKQPEDIIGKHVKKIIASESWELVDREVTLRESGEKESSHYQFKGIKQDGTIFDTEVLGNRITYQGEPAVQGMLMDITKRKQMEEEIKESEFKFRSLFDLTPHAISLTVLETGELVDVNKMFCQLMKYEKEEVLGKTVTEIKLYSTEERKKFLGQIIFEREIQGLAMDFQIKDGSKINTFVFAKIIHFQTQEYILAEFIDVTEKKRLEAQLSHAQKMEGIGTLAGGIAHDFNNILMGVQGNTNLMLYELKDTHPHHERLRSIEQLIKSGTDLTRQLLGFARGGKYQVKPTDLNELIEKTSSIFGRTKKEIKILKDLQKNVWLVDADQGQIEQVLMNLYVNAWQAMPGNGTLYLESQNLIIDKNYKKPYKFTPGSYVKISVTDTGVGIDETTLQKIFDPFFTTKGMGRGTGLGLASAYGIIKNHNGFINVYSEEGKGSTFNFYLPVSDKKFIKDQESRVAIIKGNETILLIDDEGVILEVAEEMLKTIGYKVLSAGSGKEALHVYHKQQSNIHLVILDMVMPEISGSETYDRLKEINPDIKVLLSSGYSKNGMASEILERGCDGFIQKPFTIKELSHKIRRILDNKHGSD